MQELYSCLDKNPIYSYLDLSVFYIFPHLSHSLVLSLFPLPTCTHTFTHMLYFWWTERITVTYIMALYPFRCSFYFPETRIFSYVITPRVSNSENLTLIHYFNLYLYSCSSVVSTKSFLEFFSFHNSRGLNVGSHIVFSFHISLIWSRPVVILTFLKNISQLFYTYSTMWSYLRLFHFGLRWCISGPNSP